MTTIVADAKAGVMASDSNWFDQLEKGHCRKVYRIGDALVGFAGTFKDITNALEWFASGREGKAPGGDVTALILTRGRIETWKPSDGFMHEQSPQFAIGSGSACARAAMMAGADCAKAVRIACKIDANSGGRVRVYKLEK